MRRGFKAEAERHAQALRTATGSSEHRSIDLAAVAMHLRVTVLPADRLLDDGLSALRALHDTQPTAFSAVTVSLPGRRRVVAYNPLTLDGGYLTPAKATADGRTRSNVAHEFAHIVLDHDVRSVQKLGEQYFFTCDPEQEAEANWLAAAMLLPRQLLLDAIRRGHDEQHIATEQHVSVELARFRLNATGAKMQVARARTRRSATS